MDFRGSAADEIELPHVTVYGTARTEVTPDEMIWALKVEDKGDVLEGVANEHAKHTEALLTFLKAGKVDEKTLQTSRMEFGQNWEYRSNNVVNLMAGSDEAELGSAALSLGTIPVTARLKASFRLVTSPK